MKPSMKRCASGSAWVVLALLAVPGLSVGQALGQAQGPSLPAATRPIMPPGAPPLPGPVPAPAASTAENVEPAPAVLQTVQERLQGFQVSVILDGTAMLRSSMPLPGAGGAGALPAAAVPSVLTVRHGKPFGLIGEHQLLPVVDTRSVAIYWIYPANAGSSGPDGGAERGRLVFYGEVDPSQRRPATPERLEPAAQRTQVLTSTR